MHLIQCSRFRNGEPPSNAPRHHRQGNDQTASGEDGSRCISSNVAASATANRPRTHRDTTAKATTRLHLEKMGPDASASNVAASATANHPSEQAPTPRKRIQSSCLRNSKPPSEHAPKPDKNAAPHHPRKLPNVAFWSPKRRSYYTAKATTRLHLEKMGPDASHPM